MGSLFNYPEGGTARKAASLNQTEFGDNEKRGSPELIAVYLCSRLWRHRSEATTPTKAKVSFWSLHSKPEFIYSIARSPRDAAIHVYQLWNRLQRAWGSHNSQKNGKRCTNIRHERCRKSPRNLSFLFCQKAFVKSLCLRPMRICIIIACLRQLAHERKKT